MKNFILLGIVLFAIVALIPYMKEAFVVVMIFYYLMGFFWMSVWYIDSIGEEHDTGKNMFLQISLWPWYLFLGLIEIFMMTIRRR